MRPAKYNVIILLLLCFCNNLPAQNTEHITNKELFTKGESHWFKRNLPEAIFYLNAYIQKEKQPTDSNDFVNATNLNKPGLR